MRARAQRAGSPPAKVRARTSEARHGNRVTSPAALFFRPDSVVLVGASADVSKFGGRLLRNLLKGGFPGEVRVVHPHASELMGVPCVPSLSEVPGAVDLVVVALPRERVSEVVTQCPAVGARGLIVFTSGYAETGPDGQRAQAELAALARAHGLRLLGPNCLGLYNAHARVALSANEVLDRALTPGHVGVISQSGALVGSILDRGEDIGIRFAGFVNTGNEADLDAADFLEYFASEPQITVLLAYLEGVRDWSRFARALEVTAAAGKPVIVAKAGRTALGERAVLSHTGALAGDASAFDALLRKYGAVAARDMDEALDVAHLFTRAERPVKASVGIVTISGGLAGLAADRCVELGLSVPDFLPATVGTLRGVLPGFGTPQNPLDVTGAVTSSPGLLEQCLQVVARDDGVGLMLLLLTMVYGRERLVDEILRARERAPVPFVIIWSGGSLVRPARDQLREAGLATYSCLGQALPAVRALLERAHWETLRAATPRCPFTVAQLESVRAGLEEARKRGLTEYEGKRLLAVLGLPVARERLAKDPDQAAALARGIGFPVALKVVSPQIPHKAQVGGVALDVRSEAEVGTRAREILQACRERVPEADIHGILVQEMVREGAEVIVGAIRQPGIGALIMLGLGGPLAEAVRDVTFRLAPLREVDAEEMVRDLRSARLLLRDGLPAPALVDVLVRVSWFAHGVSTVAELDINPLVLTPSGTCLVVDALIRAEPSPEVKPPGEQA